MVIGYWEYHVLLITITKMVRSADLSPQPYSGLKSALRTNLNLVIGYWLLVIGYWLLVIGYWLLVIGYWLLVIGYWLLVIGYW